MHGLVILDKPAGRTSLDVVKELKHLFGAAKAGHVGTLDPFATGVLPVLLGEATKLAPYLTGGVKRYCFDITLGAETDTCDATGRVIANAPVPALDRTTIEAVLVRFVGIQQQRPPAFSAIKQRGVPLYRMARRGEDVVPPLRSVEIISMDLRELHEDRIRIDVACGPGTYIRSLGRDLGAALGSLGHVSYLRRTASSGFDESRSQTLPDIRSGVLEGRSAEFLVPLGDMLPDVPSIRISDDEESKIRNGQSLDLPDDGDTQAGVLRLLDHRSHLVAIASRENALIRPLRVFKN